MYTREVALRLKGINSTAYLKVNAHDCVKVRMKNCVAS